MATEPSDITVLYFPGFLGRSGGVRRVLNGAGVDYKFANILETKLTATKGNPTTVFAAPVLQDGDLTLAQSVAMEAYVGQKYGLVPDSAAEFALALQYASDHTDNFNDQYGSKGDALKQSAFLTGRAKTFFAMVERQTRGPFTFGRRKTFVDYTLLWIVDSLDQLYGTAMKAGVPSPVQGPKTKAVIAALRAEPNYKLITIPTWGPNMLTLTVEDFKKTIIVIVTNYGGTLGKDNTTGYYLPEVAHPWKVFTDAGYEVQYVSPKGGLSPCDKGSITAFKDDVVCQEFLANEGQQEALRKTKCGDDVDMSGAAAIFYAGGHGPMFDIPKAETIGRKVSAFYNAGGVVGAVCHGPAGLCLLRDSNGNPIVKGKRVTCFTNAADIQIGLTAPDLIPFYVEDRLKEQGATFVVEPEGNLWGANVVVDGKLVSGQNPASATGTAEAIVKLL